MWRNWQKWNEGAPSRERVEDAVYTDVAADGGFEVGPFTIIGASASAFGGAVPAVVVRSELHDVDLSTPDFDTTSDAALHGGDLSDEVAALLALGLGARFRFGGMTRTWGLGDLRFRSPLDPQPVLFVCTANSARSQLAAALWTAMTGERAVSAGTEPADRVHPGAVAAARRGRHRPHPHQADPAGHRQAPTRVDDHRL